MSRLHKMKKEREIIRSSPSHSNPLPVARGESSGELRGVGIVSVRKDVV